MKTYTTTVWETSFLKHEIKENIQYVDVFCTLVVPVKRDYKAVLEFHLGVNYSRLKKTESLLGISQSYKRQVPSSVYDSLNEDLHSVEPQGY